MPVEFVGYVQEYEESESRPAPRGTFDREWVKRVARTHEQGDFDRALIALSSSSPDPLTMAAYCAAHTERLGMVIAHRPGFVAPTVASRMLATLDQMSHGRMAVHTISGSSDLEQQRDGDYLTKDERYARAGEYMAVLKKAWLATEPISHDGVYYKFENYGPALPTFQQPRMPMFFGGSSPTAYQIGAAHTDVYMMFGQPVDAVREEMASIRAAAEAVGRTEPLRFSISFRPILAATEAAAWERAHSIRERLRARVTPGAPVFGGAQRQINASLQGERHGRALWTGVAFAAPVIGNATALVGTPEIVAEALMEYVDLGISTILIRGFDPYEDAIQYGKELIPLVRAEVARRERAQAEQSVGALS